MSKFALNVINSWLVLVVLYSQLVLQHLLIIVTLPLSFQMPKLFRLSPSLKSAWTSSNLSWTSSLVVVVRTHLKMASLRIKNLPFTYGAFADGFSKCLKYNAAFWLTFVSWVLIPEMSLISCALSIFKHL